MTNQDIHRLVLRAIDMQGIEDDFKDANNRDCEVELTNDTPQKFRILINNPLEEFLVEVRVT